MTGPIPDKPEEIDAELAKRLTLGLQVPDFMIDSDRHPGLKEAIAYADEMRGEEEALQTRIDQSTGPAFAREFWHELRTGQPPAWSALARGFTALMFLLSIGLLASAASR